MLKIYKNGQDKMLVEEAVIRPNSLVMMIAPTAEQINQVTRDYDIPEKFFLDALDQDERPRLERDENSYLIVLNIPLKNPNSQMKNEAPYLTLPLGIIHTENNIFLVSKEPHPILQDLIDGEYGQFQTHMKTKITLLLFKAVAKHYDDHLGFINDEAAKLQQELNESYHNKELFSLINLNKSLVFFSTSLSALVILYRQIMQGKTLKIQDEDRRLLNDILADIEQSADVAEMRRESLSNLMDAYAVIVHNNLNTVLKTLTAIAIVMIIPTMIGSIFSMNVDLPEEHNPISTVIIGSGMMGISIILLLVFYFKKYIKF
ncbi:magnesium transporter CorA family protein [Ignatzschineria rhizosphaerae]|uniref:Magnesium transporter CorA family protein n=1 Tax=Ignatzschineria rhizosphaerae TaxID=2923279 RepID=A0ABY3X2J7_9GAMM|nr:magnesium transporter CorA family protein [Ignatzschineria rhizosphaerae]UNM97107.1 magnesium transporter CorA family protein [Ignatzschineria rhizosphaerae]